MKKCFAMVLVVVCLALPASMGLADEKRDHICFRTLDTDKDGLVTLQEFEEFYGNDPAAFKAADADQDGALTHDEYQALLGHGANR